MFSTELVRGTLKTIVLKLLDENPRLYGYQIIKEVRERTGDKIILTEGALYPILHKLERERLVIRDEHLVENRIRKYYSLTEEGRKASSQKLIELLSYMQTLALFIRGREQ